MSLKTFVYSCAKQTGAFRLTRAAVRGRALILAYHGFEVSDETRFRPKLFVTAATFRRHLRILKDSGLKVVPLDEIVSGVERGKLQPMLAGITIDDGFATTLSIAAPILAEFAFPATVYATTYYMQKQTPVFDLAVGYLVWKGSLNRSTISDFDPDVRGTWNLGSAQDCSTLQQHILGPAHRASSEAVRDRMCRNLAGAVGVDYDEIVLRGALRLMSFAEARQLSRYGIEIGLHTHRHIFPADSEAICRREVEQNRQYLEREVGIRPMHFCYPSGDFARQHESWLRKLDVRSATTCEAGFVGSGDSPYFLRRFLDGEMVSDLEFEAELSGFAATVRVLSGRNGATAEHR